MDKQEQHAPRPPVDITRRRLAQGGLAAPVVLASLASKSALAAAPYNCTISGKLSGNVSSHGTDQPCSGLGLSPGYWKNIAQHPWPGIDPNAPFNSIFADVYWFKVQNTNSFKLAAPGTFGYTANPTLSQVLNSGGGMDASPYPALGRAAIASYLNSRADTLLPDFPLQPQQVVEMFNAVFTGGYEVKPGVMWDAICVICYFESLYNPVPGESVYCTGGACAGL